MPQPTLRHDFDASVDNCIGELAVCVPLRWKLATRCYHPCEADMELPPVQIAEIAGNGKFVRVSGE